MHNLRIGVVGIGNIGSHHARYLSNHRVTGAELTAVCDIDASRLDWAAQNIGSQIKCFSDFDDMLASGCIDAVIIAVPHYLHPPYAIKAMEHGIHVMSEKPAGVYTKQVYEMNRKAKETGVVFGVMFNQRTTPIYQKIKNLLDAGELGALRRVSYTVTDSYRSQAYHNSSSWRGTWATEGGGALINQYAHNVDLWQWLCGLPVRVRAFSSFGKYREIEVEDEVTVYAEYANGATGVLICSTTEAPGTDRMELVGDRGKIVVENLDDLKFYRTVEEEQVFNRNNTNPFGKPESWVCNIPVDMTNFVYREGHIKICQNWVNAIQKGEKLIAPGQEGVRSVELFNAIYLSSWLDQWVKIPVDADLYYQKLQEQIQKSTFVKPETHRVVMDDMSATF